MKTNRWGIAVAGVFLQVALGAVYAWSVFRLPLAKQFGWSISEVTLTFAISIFVLGCGGIFRRPLAESRGPKIGMFDSLSCAIHPANLTAGDILVLYTDGVIEAGNSLGEEFGMERLSTLIRRGHTLSADELMSHILESVTDFSRDVGFEDDATILVVKFNF